MLETKMQQAFKNQRKPVADVNVQYNCGCGFTTLRQQLAEQHAAEENHILEAHGSIKPIGR